MRPDEESLEGWINAALKGKPLGVQVSESVPKELGPVVCLSESGGVPLTALIELGEPITVIYGEPLSSCDKKLEIGLRLPTFLSVAIVNILLDNWRVFRRERRSI